MLAIFPHSIDPAASARSNPSHVFVEQLVDQLAEDLIALQAEGDATRLRLLERGWAPSFLDTNLAEAQRRANARFVRQLDAEPVKTLAQVETEMAEIIASLLPATSHVIAELQARGIPKGQLDLLFQKARARAAYAFCHGKSGMAN